MSEVDKNITRPTTDQILFRSGATGDHVLDTYLEAAEIGGRPLAHLMEEIFDPTGKVHGDFLQFRLTPNGEYEYRAGQFLDDAEGWNPVGAGALIRHKGSWRSGITLEAGDAVEYANGYYLAKTPHLTGATFDEAKFFTIVNPAALTAAVSSILTATSTTAIQLSTGQKTLSVQEGKRFMPGQFILISADAPQQAQQDSWLYGRVVSYVSNLLTVSIIDFWNSGRPAPQKWNVAVSAPMSSALSASGVQTSPDTPWPNVQAAIDARLPYSLTGQTTLSTGLNLREGVTITKPPQLEITGEVMLEPGMTLVVPAVQLDDINNRPRENKTVTTSMASIGAMTIPHGITITVQPGGTLMAMPEPEEMK